MKYYFIYGTLKKGMKNSHIMKNVHAKYIADVATVKPFPMFDLGNGFPYVQNVKGKGSIIKGELYGIECKYEKDLDSFEGVPDLYNRGFIDVETIVSEAQPYKLPYTQVSCYFITDELDNFELNDVELFNEWLEPESNFDFDAHIAKLREQRK